MRQNILALQHIFRSTIRAGSTACMVQQHHLIGHNILLVQLCIDLYGSTIDFILHNIQVLQSCSYLLQVCYTEHSSFTIVLDLQFITIQYSHFTSAVQMYNAFNNTDHSCCTIHSEVQPGS